MLGSSSDVTLALAQNGGGLKGGEAAAMLVTILKI